MTHPLQCCGRAKVFSHVTITQEGRKMFTWFKVLRQLSNEQDLLTEHEKRFTSMLKSFSDQEEKLKELEQKLQAIMEEAAQRQEKIQESIALLNSIEVKIKAYTDIMTEKCRELKGTAVEYAEQLNQTVDGYEKKLSDFHQQVMEIKQAVVDFQR